MIKVNYIKVFGIVCLGFVVSTAKPLDCYSVVPVKRTFSGSPVPAGTDVSGPAFWNNKQPFKPFAGRLAYSADGNYHDEDDIAANPFALMLLAESGYSDRLVHVEYGNHIWYTRPSQLERLDTATMRAAVKFGFDPGIFFNCIKDRFAAYNHLKEQILASDETNPLSILGAGPMHTIYQALKLASEVNAEKLKYVTLISHSPATGDSSSNNEHGLYDNKKKGKDPLHSHNSPEKAKVWDDIVKDFPAVNLVIIRGQNGLPDIKLQGYDFCVAYTNLADQWMETSPDQNVRWVWNNMKAVFRQKADVSDAGMVWYWLTGGDQYGNLEKVKQAFAGTWLVNENFNTQAVGRRPDDWRCSGDVTIQQIPGISFQDRAIRMVTNSKKGVVSASRIFSGSATDIVIDFDLMLTGNHIQDVKIALKGKAGQDIVVLKTFGKSLRFKNRRNTWDDIGTISSSKLHHITIRVDSLTETCTVVLDGRIVKDKAHTARRVKAGICEINFVAGTDYQGAAYFDYLKVFHPVRKNDISLLK